MSYCQLFEQNRMKIHRKAVSTKILDSIHKLMMEVNENSPRRWVWELIQNAGDAAKAGEEVDILVHLKEEKEGWRLEFSHSGRPFDVLTLTSLMNQVSGKERGPQNGRESAGRFGTGFMTTHLLSRRVEVRSVIQERGEACKRFRILLDRSKDTLREIEEALELALGELEALDQAPDCGDYREGELNTVFSYLLDDRGVETALAGIRDLKENVEYMLAFGEGVGCIRLVDEWNGEEARYRRAGAEAAPGLRDGDLAEGILLAATEKCCGGGSSCPERSYFLIAADGQVQTAVRVQVDGEMRPVRLMGPENGSARLFCCFPLIGTEAFPFPAVVNSRAFEPTEPRDGIYLTGRDIPEVRRNEQLFGAAVLQLERLADCLADLGVQGLYQLLQIPEIPERAWLSADWIRAQWNSLRFLLCRKPLFTGTDGRRRPALGPMGEPLVCVPSGGTDCPQITDKLWELMAERNDRKPLPGREELRFWEALLPECRVTAEQLLRQLCTWGKLESLAARLGEPGETGQADPAPVRPADQSAARAWLKAFRDLIKCDPALSRAVAAGEYNIFLNLEGGLIAITAARRANAVPEAMFRAALKAGVLLEKTVLDPELDDPGLFVRELTAGEVAEMINDRLFYCGMGENSQYRDAILAVTALRDEKAEDAGQRRELYEVCRAFFGEAMPAAVDIPVQGARLWWKSDSFALRLILDTLAARNNLGEELPEIASRLGASREEALAWFGKLADLAYAVGRDSLIHYRKRKGGVFPNQEGILCRPWNLWLDGGIDETLKDVAQGLGLNLRGTLAGFHSRYPVMAVMEPDAAARRLEDCVWEILESPDRQAGEEERRSIHRLFQWMQSRPGEAAKLFKRLYPKRFLLCDQSYLESRDQKADQLERLLLLAGAEGPEQLEALLQARAQGGEMCPDPEWDFDGLPEPEARERRAAGEWGERFVWEYLIRRHEAGGARLTGRTEQSAFLVLAAGQGEEQIEIRRMDTERYKQSGFDIGVFRDGTLEDFYEVKSTRGGSFNHMRLSESQAVKAFTSPGRYHLAAVLYAMTERASVKVFCWGEERGGSPAA